jgi:hypothetical protein
MPVVSWFASFIFLGLSLSIGLLIYYLLYKKRKEKEPDLPPELKISSPGENEPSSLEELEKKYGKKG